MARRGTALLFYFTVTTPFKLKLTYVTSLWVTEMRGKYKKNIVNFVRLCRYYQEGADPVRQLRTARATF